MKNNEYNSSKLAVIFPGIGYHKDKPLLYYAAKLMQSKGYDILNISFSDMPSNVKGDASLMRKAADIASAQTSALLKDVNLSSYDDVVFIGKSLGTVALSKYASENAPNVTQIWYTPVEATFSFCTPDSKNIIAFIGDNDPWSDLSVIKKSAEESDIKLHIYPECNHSLECGDPFRNIDVLKDVMEKTRDFIRSISA
ncbi:phosphoglycolate phosphatase [Lachnospiraceae bacterium]|nr:phosphoglycolate phosphatase [Lachnospiraceae bacterium]